MNDFPEQTKKTVTYVKSLLEILRTVNGDTLDIYTYDGQIYFEADSWNYALTEKMIQFCGKPLSDAAKKEWSWDRLWLEEREVEDGN